MSDQKHLIIEFLESTAGKHPEYPAVRWFVKKNIVEKTYGDLDRDRRKAANALLARGFAGQQIALIGPSAYEWIAGYLGIVSAKMTAVPLDPMLPPEELLDLIIRSDSKAVFVSPRHSHRAGKVSGDPSRGPARRGRVGGSGCYYLR